MRTFASASSARARAIASGCALQHKAEAQEAAPAPEPRKQLAARLFSLGAIPIAVFCAVYLLVAKLIGLDSPNSQAWTLSLALAGSLASLFVLASLGSRAFVGEIDAVRGALNHVVRGGERPELPELTPPLEGLKHEVLQLAQEFQSQQAACRSAWTPRASRSSSSPTTIRSPGCPTARPSRNGSRARW